MSVADSVKVGLVPLYQPFDPFGDAGLSVMVVTGATVSIFSAAVVCVVSVFPALSTDQ